MLITWPKAPKIQIQFTYRIKGHSRDITQPAVTEHAHRIFKVTMNALSKRRPMRRMRFQGWRCETHQGAQRRILEIVISEGQDVTTISSCDPLLSERFEKFILATECSCRASDKNEYEPRLLRISVAGWHHAEDLEVLWLKPATRSLGIFIPLDARRVGLMPGQAYGILSFRRALLDL